MSGPEVSVVSGAADHRVFLRLPERLYADDPNWVCPLRIERRAFFDPRKNPFFANADVQLFLAWRDSKPVGRISAHVYHPHNRVHNERTGFFGFFECENDYAVAEALWNAAASWLREWGMDRMRGPANFTTNHEIGFLVDGFDRPPVVMMTYNPPYYREFAERYGFSRAMDFFAYFGIGAEPFEPRAARLLERIRERSRVTIRSLDLSRFEDEVARVKKIYNAAWMPNWGFVPMDDAEFDHMGRDLKQIVDPRIVLFAEIDGEPVGFSLALPDINQVLIRLRGRLFPFGLLKLLWLWRVRHLIKRIRVMVMGILPEHQKRGIDNLLHYETYRRGIAAGYCEAEMSWILETNAPMIGVVEGLGYRRYKTYRMYEVPFS